MNALLSSTLRFPRRPEGEDCIDDARIGDDEWDEFLARHPGSHHEQCSQYGRIRELYGYECHRVALRKRGRIIGGAQILVQSTPIGRLAVVLRGPLAVDDDPATMEQTVNKIDELARSRGYASIRAETFPTQAVARQALEKAGFETSRAWFGQRPSLLVSLDGSAQRLLEQMKPKGRYNIRLAARKGVMIQLGDEASLADFYRLHRLTAEHKEFPGFPFEYFQYLWKVFGARGRVQHFLACHGGKPVAAIFNALVDDRMYYCAGGLHRGPAESRLMANYLLHFHAMEWAGQQGCTHYDLIGVTRFKERIAHRTIYWPPPLRKNYGPGRALRRRLTSFSWEKPILRRSINRMARRFGYNKQLPW